MSHSMIPADWGLVHPLQPRERESRVAKARKTMTVEVTGMYTSEAAVNATELLRWEATLRQLEEVLAGVTAELETERDAYRAFFSWWLGKDTVESALVDHVYALVMANESSKDAAAWRAALEGIRDLPQPSGNSGGFEAAAGILADTWDGEKSEVTIRRLREYGIARDGTPASAITKTIAETRMGEPNAIDAEEEET